MKKVYQLVVFIIICSLICGCEKEAPTGYNPENTNDYISSEITSTNDNGKVLSKQDIVDFLKNEYCETELSPINNTMYYSADGNIELQVSSTKVSYIDLTQDVQILVLFKGDSMLIDDQNLRIKISDGLFGKNLSSETTIYNDFFALLDGTNIKYDFSQPQIKQGLNLTESKIAIKTYNYDHNNIATFTLQERLDTQGENIIGRDLFCDFYSDVLIDEN